VASVFEEGEALKSSFNLLRLGTRLKAVNDSCFVIEAFNETALTFVKTTRRIWKD
jgi:hypothetical protein